MALDAAADLYPGEANIAFAILLHDLGKGITPESNWPSHIGHESAGVALVDAVCERVKAPNAMHDLARKVCAEHLNCHRILEARPATVQRMLERLDVYRGPKTLPAFVAACEADYRGREGLQDRPYPQGEYMLEAHRSAAAIRARDLGLEGLSGPEVGERLRQARIDAIARTAS